MIAKKGVSKFELVGKVKLTNFTFKKDQESKNSDWIRNVLNLIVDCGQGNEIIANMSGGYFKKSKPSFVYVHGKKQKLDNDNKPVFKKVKDKEIPVMTDDYKNFYKIAWEDRKTESIIADVGEGSFIKIGIVKDKEGKTYTEKFLSAYDAIEYLEKHKDDIDGKTIRVNGDIKYNLYNGNVKVEKEIKSIYISKVEDEKDFKAEFTQTIFADKNSFGRKDKETGLYDIECYVAESMKEYDGKKIPKEYFADGKKSANMPLARIFNAENENLEKLFKDRRMKKDFAEMIMVGKIIEGRQKEEIDLSDLDEDIRALIDAGMYSEDEIAKTLAVKTERVSQWILEKPLVVMEGDADNKRPKIKIEFEKYKDEDFILTFLAEDSEDDDVETIYEEEDSMEVVEDEDDWLKALED